MSAAVIPIDTPYALAQEGLALLRCFAAPTTPIAEERRDLLIKLALPALAAAESFYGFGGESAELWSKILRRCGDARVADVWSRRATDAPVYDLAEARARRAGGAP